MTVQKHSSAVKVPVDLGFEDRLACGLAGKKLMILAGSAVCGSAAQLALPAPVALAALALIARRLGGRARPP